MADTRRLLRLWSLGSKLTAEFSTESRRKMLEAGIIVRSESKWASPLVPVCKKDGSIRICVDFRELN